MAIQSKEILLIEDAPEVRILIKKILENSGMTVSDAASLEAGMKILTQKTVHLILLDLNLPGANGFEFLKLRNSSADLKDIPVIVVSGLNDKASVHRSISLGAQDYIVKPCSANILIQKVRKHLKDIEYQKYVFPDAERPKAQAFIATKIAKMGETSFMVESLTRLGPNQPLRFGGDTEDRLGIQECVVRTSTLPSSKKPNGFYLCRVNVAAVKQSLIKTLKKAP